MGGAVVHAVKGDRASYRPIQSSLCPGSRAPDILAALLRLHAFNTVYIADIDAILKRGNNDSTLAEISNCHPDIDLWVDAGVGDESGLSGWLCHGQGRPVIGSETLSDATFPRRAGASCRPILSLDYCGDALLGPRELAALPEYWPEEVIAMTLSRVGSGLGPDLQRLRQLRALAPAHRIFAAGGVSSVDDLLRLAGLGVAGVLLASALHNGALNSTDLAACG
jgi:phosphoribosylformimino-5-aminoimidazole carboxamide ribotide isomerase